MTGNLLTLRAFLSLAAVIAVLGACLWALRRGSLRFPALGARASIAVETATSLGERQSLAIVAVEGRRLLVGLTPGAVSLLLELSPRATSAQDDSRGRTGTL